MVWGRFQLCYSFVCSNSGFFSPSYLFLHWPFNSFSYFMMLQSCIYCSLIYFPSKTASGYQPVFYLYSRDKCYFFVCNAGVLCCWRSQALHTPSQHISQIIYTEMFLHQIFFRRWPQAFQPLELSWTMRMETDSDFQTQSNLICLLVMYLQYFQVHCEVLWL